jgi:putative Mg2+ transporter-C (MgtC) family protein
LEIGEIASMETYHDFIRMLPTFILRGGFAILCGSMIGIERERRGKPAGFRTNTLICVGSTLYMLVSEFIIQQVGISGIDPTRIAAQVVTGIGFLGAGTIIQARGTIMGLTTAAGIWVVAAIGLIIGAGFPWIGLVCTFMVLATLTVLHKIEPHLLGKCNYVKSKIVFSEDGGRTRGEIANILNEHDLDFSKSSVERIDSKTSVLNLRYCDKHPSHHRFLPELWRTPGIIEITQIK